MGPRASIQQVQVAHAESASPHEAPVNMCMHFNALVHAHRWSVQRGTPSCHAHTIWHLLSWYSHIAWMLEGTGTGHGAHAWQLRGAP